MKIFVWSVAAVAASVILSGCGPTLAQIEPGAEERNWQQAIQADYPGYKPPRMAPPAIEDNTQRKAAEPAAAVAPAGLPAAEEIPADPVAAVDTAADKSMTPAAEVPAAVPAPEVKPAPAVKSAAAKAPEVKAAAPVVSGSGEVYVVKPGDSLGKIARKFYGDARCYDLIVKANNITDPNKVRPGTKLVIPQL